MNKMDIDGKPIKSTSELVAVRDANGHFCAGIKVLNNLEGLSYDSYNGIVKVDKKPGQDIIYISSNERVVEIFCSGYEPLKIILYDVGIILSPKEVWTIKIHGEKTGELSSSKKGRIYLKLLPDEANASFKIEGLPVEGRSPYEAELIAGKYKFFINPKSPFYQNKEVEITISEGEKTESIIELEDISGRLMIEVAQTSIRGFINDRYDYELSTNSQKRMAQGEYKIKIEKDGKDSDFYNPYEEIIKISKGENVNVTAHLEDISGYIEIKFSPKDIKAFINGAYDQELSSKFHKRLISGKYDINIESKYHIDSYSKCYHTIDIEKGKTVILAEELVPKYGLISLNSNIDNVIYSVIDLETDICILKGKNIDNESLLMGKYKVLVDADSEGYLKKDPDYFKIKENENKTVGIIFSDDDNLEYKNRLINDIYNIKTSSSYWETGETPAYSIVQKNSSSIFISGKQFWGLNYCYYDGRFLYNDILISDNSGLLKLGVGKFQLSKYLHYCELFNLGWGYIVRSQNHKNRFMGEISIGWDNILFWSLGRYSFPREKMYQGQPITFIDLHNNEDLKKLESLRQEYFTKYIPYSGEISCCYEKYLYNTFFFIKIGVNYIFTSEDGSFIAGTNISEDWYYTHDLVKYRNDEIIYLEPLNIERFCYFFPFISFGVIIK